MVQGNRKKKSLSRELMAENPGMSYTEAVSEIENRVAPKVMDEAFIAQFSPTLQSKLKVGQPIGEGHLNVLEWEKLREMLPKGWFCELEGHFGKLHVGRKVDGHMFGLMVVSERSVHDTLELGRVGEQRVTVTFPLEEDPEDLFGEGEEFLGMRYSKAITPEGKSRDDFFKEIVSVAEEFDSAIREGRMPALETQSNSEFLINAEMYAFRNSPLKDSNELHKEVQELERMIKMSRSEETLGEEELINYIMKQIAVFWKDNS